VFKAPADKCGKSKANWLFNQISVYISGLAGVGNDTIIGTTGAEAILAGVVNDTLLGLAGGDTYIYASGNGSDYLDDEAGFTNNTDILLFADLNASDVSLSQDGVHLLITINATNETITVDEQFYSEVDYWGIERIDFANGSTLNRAQILDAVA
jgi:Ca2+-binding RTX toxin-like protein